MKKIAVGGMIGAGKSTLVNYLGENIEKSVICSEFRKDDELFNTLLKNLYEHKKGVEFAFQSYIIQHHHETVQSVEKVNNEKDFMFIDRFIIEHWLFAQTNLKHDSVLLNTYNCMFHGYMNNIVLPDLYIILDIDWDAFVKRIYKRGRKVEIDNFKQNEEYFKALLKDYTKKVIAQCDVYNIPYEIFFASDLNSEELGRGVTLDLENRGWL